MGKGDSDLYNEDDLSWGGAIKGPKRGEILDQMRDADLCEVLIFYLLFIVINLYFLHRRTFKDKKCRIVDHLLSF